MYICMCMIMYIMYIDAYFHEGSKSAEAGTNGKVAGATAVAAKDEKGAAAKATTKTA